MATTSLQRRVRLGGRLRLARGLRARSRLRVGPHALAKGMLEGLPYVAILLLLLLLLLEPGPGFGVGRGFAIRGPFPVQAPDKAPETCTWSTRSADRGSQVSALGVGLPSGTPFRCRHRIKHRKRAPGQRGLRVGANLQSRNLDGNQIAWKYRRCAGHANLLFRDGVKRQVGKCDCLLEFTTRPELSQSRARIWPQQHVPKRLKNSATRNSRDFLKRGAFRGVACGQFL